MEIPENHPLARFFGLASRETSQEVEERQYQYEKSFLQPSWREVTNKDTVTEYFLKWSTQEAQHAVSCTSPECEHCLGRRVTFCTPDLFVHYVQLRLVTLFKNVPESRDMIQFWGSRDRQKVAMDPRYVLFRSRWDEIVVSTAITRECLQSVYNNLGIEVD